MATWLFSCSSNSQIYPSKSFTPESSNSSESLPLLIFLHGAGERGSDLDKLGLHGPLKELDAGREFDCLIWAPLCPEDVWWEVDKLQASFEKFLSEHNVDMDRIYLTGLSMGGYASWHWACARPDLFAAFAPICGGGNTEDVEAIVNLPVWVFHGEKDDVVSIEESRKMVKALQEAGGSPRFTTYPEAYHDSWTMTYSNDKFYEWLFSFSK